MNGKKEGGASASTTAGAELLSAMRAREQRCCRSARGGSSCSRWTLGMLFPAIRTDGRWLDANAAQGGSMIHRVLPEDTATLLVIHVEYNASSFLSTCMVMLSFLVRPK